ncbi:hypothetical protein KR50_35150 [Jeotgalibacillus campisalis]|uniref:Uncharacterized protein n=1 Tax=Jeotgalibacillus campisalis TaxID=220754 RepID=A0A0C2V238_9BACL|nr:hypothetical protein KR50_35150 [Jeotgalibacillus campisalis]
MDPAFAEMMLMTTLSFFVRLDYPYCKTIPGFVRYYLTM